MSDNTSIDLGRKGYITSDGRVRLEVQRFAGNHPTVEKIVGVSPKGELRTQRMQPTSSPRSGGGNGEDYYTLVDGVYWINDILSTSSYRYRTFISLVEGELGEYSRDDLDEVLAEHFAGDLAVAKEAQRVHKERLVIAQEILAEIAEERKSLATPVKEGELTAHPEFGDLPSADSVVSSMARQEFDRLSFVMTTAAPRHFVVHNPVFAKASTPEQAFAQARVTIASRQAQLDAAKGKADEAGWPALTGSEKQIRWAETIRAKVAAKDPKAKALKTATTAKYWIDNHRFA